MPDRVKEKLVELICNTHYGVENRSTIGANFQRRFIEKIADNLITNGVTVQEWIPVTEDLPKSCEKVLVSVKNFDQSLIGWYDVDYEGWFVEEGLSERKDLTVTHWQEKPRAAKGAE